MTADTNISLDTLIEGRRRGACYGYIAHIATEQYNALVDTLVSERNARKQREIMDIFRRCNCDWTETLHVVLFRFLGGKHNRAASERLASIVTNHIIMRENSSLANIEALLFGASGLLDIYNADDYISHLKQEFSHLSLKYSITPMSHEEWHFSGMYYNNHPALRLAQIAACLHENKISVQSITSCATRRDVYDLFSGRATEYWMQQVLPYSNVHSIAPRIGSVKSDILGINLVAPLMYAYGSYTESQKLISRAIALLRNIPAEDNRYTRQWNRSITTAVESQALIQLSTEYCGRTRCHECPLAKLILYNDQR